MTFSDGSTILIKANVISTEAAVLAPTSSKSTGEIIKGTGRFEGIKGIGTVTTKYFLVEEGETGARGIGEGTLTYTLPTK